MSHLPSYNECLRICQSSDNLFYETKFNVYGFKVSVFNYRTPTYQDFVNFNSFELRGLTFVFNLDGTLFKRYLSMEKFFNLNENESTQLESLKDKKIKSVYLKEDGSLINFIKLPNNVIVAKSKNSFESTQAKLAQKIFDTDKFFRDNIIEMLEKDIIPTFELVGPTNRVVVKYDNTELILLRLRDNQTGDYLSIDDSGLNIPESFTFSLSDLLELKSKLENVEGWIVEFIDGQKVKIKTDWYFSLHRIFTDYSNREDYLVNLILEQKIDDVLSVLDSGSESKKFVESIIVKTNQAFQKIDSEVSLLFSHYHGDRKDFAIKYKDHPYFPIVIKWIIGFEKNELITDYIRKKTNKLESARKWLHEF